MFYPLYWIFVILVWLYRAIDNGDNDYDENYAINGNDDSDVEEDIDGRVSCQLAQSPDSLATDNICLVIIIIIITTLILILISISITKLIMIITIPPIPLDKIRKEVPIDASFTWLAIA